MPNVQTATDDKGQRPSVIAAQHQEHSGWIDVPICEGILTKPIKLLVGVDGSDEANAALEFASKFAQSDRESFLEVVHVWDELTQKDIPPDKRRDPMENMIEAKLASCVPPRRSKKSILRKGNQEIGEVLCERIVDLPADYTCLGVQGWSERAETSVFAEDIYEVLRQGNTSVMVFQTNDTATASFSTQKPTKFLVSANLNKASTKAFLDAMRMSKPGDEVHACYVKSFMENGESDYTKDLRAKFEGFFGSLKDKDNQKVFSKFHDRITEFVMVPKRRRETTPHAFLRYADEIDADFIVVGTNSNRVERGKTPLGSVSMQICMETVRNFMVSNWVDLKPEVYETSVRRTAVTPLGGSRTGTANAPNRGIGPL